VPEAGHLDRRGLTARRNRRRRRVALAIGGALVVALAAGGVALAASALGGEHDTASAKRPPPASTPPPLATTSTSTPTTAVPTPSAPDTTATTEAPAPADLGHRYPVGTWRADYVDTSRSTSPNGDFGGSPTRDLPTAYWYPATADGGAPDRANGPYPLVLFVHGYDQTPDFYAALLERWASAGYVVAAPTFPILSGIPGGPSHVDYTKLFGDAKFVIDRTLASGPDTPIGGLADGTRVAAAGHSDGEMVAFTMGFASCCKVWPFTSIVAMAGDLGYADVDPIRDSGLPILHIMETNDEYDPYADSVQWDRDHLTPPRWSLSLLGATHAPPYTQAGNPYFELVATTTIDFLDGTLKDRPDRLDALTGDVAAAPGLASLER
jgi:dienelactone hydrolase